MKIIQKNGLRKKITAVLFCLFLFSPEIAIVGRTINIGYGFIRARYDRSFSEIISRYGHKIMTGKGDVINDDRRLTLDVKTVKKIGGWKYAFVDINGFLQRLMGKNFIPDADPNKNIYRLTNGQITTINTRQETSILAERLLALRNFAEKNNIDFLYVQAPFKDNKYDSKLPAGIQDFSNENADNFLDQFRNGGGATVDLRDVLHQEGKDYASLFFSSDHHWKPETGFRVCRILVEYLNKQFDFNVVKPFYTNIDNYEVKTLKNWFLGSLGKRTGKYYSGLDDFSIISPLFGTELTVATMGGQEYSGTLSQLLFFDNNTQVRNNYLQDCYLYYIGWNYSLQHLVNKKSDNCAKIMLIHDSFANVVTPYLALCYKEVISVDIRTSERDFSLMKLIEKESPDIIIVIYSTDSITDKKRELNRSPFDFEGSESLKSPR